MFYGISTRMIYDSDFMASLNKEVSTGSSVMVEAAISNFPKQICPS